MPFSEELKQEFSEMMPRRQEPMPRHQEQNPALQQKHQYNHQEYLKAFAGYKNDEVLKRQLKVLGVGVFVVTLGLVVLVNYHRDLEKRMFTHEPNLGPGATQAAPINHAMGGLGGNIDGGTAAAAAAGAHANLQMQLQAQQGRIPAAQMPYVSHYPAAHHGYVQAPAPQYSYGQSTMPAQAMMPNGVYTVPMTRPGEMIPPCLVVPIQDSSGNFRVKRIVGR